MRQNKDLCNGSHNMLFHFHIHHHVGIHLCYIFLVGLLECQMGMYKQDGLIQIGHYQADI